MKCYDEKTIVQYLDGELAAEQSMVFENHTKECFTCLSLVEEYKAIYQQFAVIDIPEPETTFTDKVIKDLPAINFRRKKKIAQAVYAFLIFSLLCINALLLPFHPVWQDMGARWDMVKVFWYVLTQLAIIPLMLLEAVWHLTISLWAWMSVFRRVLYFESTLILLFSLFILLASIIFIKLITSKNEKEELVK